MEDFDNLTYMTQRQANPEVAGNALLLLAIYPSLGSRRRPHRLPPEKPFYSLVWAGYVIDLDNLYYLVCTGNAQAAVEVGGAG